MRTGILAVVGLIAVATAAVIIVWLLRVPNMFEVSGSSDITYTPDEATIMSSVYAEGASQPAVKSEVATTMRAVLAALKAAGVDDKDVSSTVITAGILDEDSDGDKSASDRTFYGEQGISIEVRDIKRIGVVLDAISAAGANFWKVRYHTSESAGKKLDAAARKSALQNAIATADQYARDGQFKRGRVLKIQDDATEFPEVDFSAREYRTSRSKISRNRSGVEKVTVTGTRISIPDTSFNIPPPKEQVVYATTHVLFAIE